MLWPDACRIFHGVPGGRSRLASCGQDRDSRSSHQSRSSRMREGRQGTVRAARTLLDCSSLSGDGPKVGLAYEVGGQGDHSFNDAAAKE